MPTFKNLPWLSLTLLLVTYSILGWLLSAFKGPISLWIVVIGADLLLATALSSPWSQMKDGFARLLKSDTRAFFVAVILAFLSVVIITWLQVFVHILVVIAAGILVRLDTQTAGWNNRQSFWSLAIISLASLGLGAVGQTLLEKWLMTSGL